MSDNAEDSPLHTELSAPKVSDAQDEKPDKQQALGKYPSLMTVTY